MAWGHNDLQADLATYLAGTGRRVWCDMQLGPSGSARPDVYTIHFSFTQFQPIAYEVKVSRADLLRDLGAQKYTKYHRFSSGVFFAFPTGMAKKDEIPAECGVITRGDTGWRTLRSPRFKLMDTLPREVWMKLVIDGIERFWRTRPRVRSEWDSSTAIRKKFGKEVAKILQDRQDYEGRVALLQQRAADMDKEVNRRFEIAIEDMQKRISHEQKLLNTAVAGAAAALGLGQDANIYDITHRLEQIRAGAEDPEGKRRSARLLQKLQSLKSSLEQIASGVEKNIY